MSSNGEYPKVWRLTLYCWVWLGLLPKFFNEQNLFLVQNSKILHFLAVKSEFYHTPKCDKIFLFLEILIRPRNFISLQFSQKQLKSSRGFFFIGNFELIGVRIGDLIRLSDGTHVRIQSNVVNVTCRGFNFELENFRVRVFWKELILFQLRVCLFENGF